jgi:hypothetical protein
VSTPVYLIQHPLVERLLDAAIARVYKNIIYFDKLRGIIKNLSQPSRLPDVSSYLNKNSFLHIVNNFAKFS